MTMTNLAWMDAIPLSTTLQIALAFPLLSFIFFYLTKERPYAKFPVVTFRGNAWEALLPASFAWIKYGKRIQTEGTAKYKTPFQVATGSGYRIIVPNRFAHELRNDPRLSLIEAHAKDQLIYLPGFEGPRAVLGDEAFIQDIVKIKLTQSLALFTPSLVDETAVAVSEIFGNDREWTVRPASDGVSELVSRQSARVFLGKGLSRNQEWISLTKAYLGGFTTIVDLLRFLPEQIRPLCFWFLPLGWRLLEQVRRARKILEPHFEERRQERARPVQFVEPQGRAPDSIDWLLDIEKTREVDFAAAQLAICVVAVPTTAETIKKCVLQLCETPELVPLLRNEIVDVLKKQGWSRNAFFQMQLLDSFLKEVLRMTGLSSTSMKRLVKEDFTLSDGTVLPKGSYLMVSDDRALDETIWPNASKFDCERFLRLRQEPGNANSAQFVALNSYHMGFGYGNHACPGRFFASNQVKIALCCLLLQYDFRFVPGAEKPKTMEYETVYFSDPGFVLQMRRRTEDIDLFSMKVDGQPN